MAGSYNGGWWNGTGYNASPGRLPVYKDLTESAHIRFAATKDLTETANVRAAASKDLVDAAHIRFAVTKDLTETASVRFAVSKELLGVYDFLSARHFDLEVDFWIPIGFATVAPLHYNAAIECACISTVQTS